jgi:hypothetical protein
VHTAFAIISLMLALGVINLVWGVVTSMVSEMRSGPREPIKWVVENERINAARRDRT